MLHQAALAAQQLQELLSEAHYKREKYILRIASCAINLPDEYLRADGTMSPTRSEAHTYESIDQMACDISILQAQCFEVDIEPIAVTLH